jgi:hypothetical protein
MDLHEGLSAMVLQAQPEGCCIVVELFVWKAQLHLPQQVMGEFSACSLQMLHTNAFRSGVFKRRL